MTDERPPKISLPTHRLSADRLATIGWGLAAAILAIAFSWDLMTYKKVLLHPDIYTYYFPFRRWFWNALAAGHFPLWNPNWGLGHPVEAWGSIPLDPYTLLELAFGAHYGLYHALQAALLVAASYLVLILLEVRRAIAAPMAILFFLSPWTNYFFYYFIITNNYIGYIFLFYFLYRWLATSEIKYLFFIAWTMFLSMLGTQLEFWFHHSVVVGLLSVVGPWLIGTPTLRTAVRASIAAIGALGLGIAAQAWQLDILVGLITASARELDHSWLALSDGALWRNLGASLFESAFLQLAVVATLSITALRSRGRFAASVAVLAAALLMLFLALPTPFGGASRDGGLRHLSLDFVRSPELLAALTAICFGSIFGVERDWRRHLEASAFYLVFVYYFCRSGHGDLGEVDVIASMPQLFRLGLGVLVWFGCRRLPTDPVCRFAYASVLFVLLLRDQGQIVLSWLAGWSWVPTRDNYIIEFALVLIGARGATDLANVKSFPLARFTSAPGALISLCTVAATLVATSGNLYHVHPLIGSGPPGYPYFAGVPSLRHLIDDVRTAPTDRFYFANDNFMEFHQIMGTSLAAGAEQATIYASLTSARYREWAIYQNTGVRPEAHWRGYTNDLSPGTIARMPSANMLGYSNSAIYAATLTSRPPPRRGVLELLGIKHVLRLYPIAGEYRIENGVAPPRDDLIDGIDPVRITAISADTQTPRPMFVAELSPLPRAFTLVPPSSSSLGELRETLDARAENGNLVTPSFVLPVTAARIEVYEPMHVVIDADAPTASVLVLSDLYHPFWQARIDGQSADIFPMFHIMRGVALPAGHHRVEFICRVPGLVAACWVSGAILVLSIGVFGFIGRKRLLLAGSRLLESVSRSPLARSMQPSWLRDVVTEFLVVAFFVNLAAMTLAIHDRPTLMQDQSLTFDHWWYFYDRLRHGSLAQWNPYLLMGRIHVLWNYVPASIFYLPLLLAEPRVEYFPYYNAFGTFFAYLGMYLAGRMVGYGRLLPLLPIVVLAGSGNRYLANFLHFTAYLMLFPMAIALLLRMSAAAARPTLRQWATFGLLLALAFAGLKLEMTVYAVALAGLTLIGFTWSRATDLRGRLTLFGCGTAALAAGLAANAWQMAYLLESTANTVRLAVGFHPSALLDPIVVRWTLLSLAHQPATLPIAINAGLWLFWRRTGQALVRWHSPVILFVADFVAVYLMNWRLSTSTGMAELLSTNAPYDYPEIRLIGPIFIAGILALGSFISLCRQPTMAQAIAGVTAIFLGLSVSTYSWEYWPLHVQHHFFFLPPTISVYMAVGAVGLALSRRFWILAVLFAFHFIAETASLPMWEVAGIPWNAPRAAPAEIALQAVLIMETVLVLARVIETLLAGRLPFHTRLLAHSWLLTAAMVPLVAIGALFFNRAVLPMQKIPTADAPAGLSTSQPAADFPFAAAPPGEAGRFRNDWVIAAAKESRARCDTANPGRDPQQRIRVPDDIVNFDPKHPVFSFLPAYSGCLNTAPAYASEIPRGLQDIFNPTPPNGAGEITPHPEASPLLTHMVTDIMKRDKAEPAWYFTNLLVMPHQGSDIVGQTLLAEQGTTTQRAFVAHRIAVFPDIRSERDALQHHLEHGGKLADLLTTSDPRFHGDDAADGHAPDQVVFLSDQPERVIVQVDASAPGYLVLLDLWSHGWSAESNGLPVPLYRGYVGLRFVPIPAGRSAVTFSYRVPGLATAGPVSIIVLLGLVAGMTVRRRPRTTT